MGRGGPGIGGEIGGSEWMSGSEGQRRQAYRDGLFCLCSWDDCIRALVSEEEARTFSGHCTPAPGEGLTPLTEA